MLTRGDCTGVEVAAASHAAHPGRDFSRATLRDASLLLGLRKPQNAAAAESCQAAARSAAQQQFEVSCRSCNTLFLAVQVSLS